jgi:hypothetical protein
VKGKREVRLAWPGTSFELSKKRVTYPADLVIPRIFAAIDDQRFALALVPYLSELR